MVFKEKNNHKITTAKILAIAFLSGFLSLELEILATRLLTPIFGSTIYVWTSLIGMTLLFLSIGYYVGGKLADKKIVNLNFLGYNLLIIGVYIGFLPFIARFVLKNLYSLNLIAGPLISSFILFLIPMTLLGFIVPTAIKLFTTSLNELGTKAGEVYAIASMGSIAGAFVTGFYFILHLGLIKTTFITSIIVILFSFLFIKSKIKFLFLLIPLLLFIIPDSRSEQILDDYPSFYSQVRVIDFGSGPSLFRSFYEIASLTPPDQIYDDQYSIAFAYNPDIKDILLIGFGSGNTAKELLATYPNINLDIVEIEPAMKEIYNKYSEVTDDATIEDASAKILTDDSATIELLTANNGYSSVTDDTTFDTNANEIKSSINNKYSDVTDSATFETELKSNNKNSEEKPSVTPSLRSGNDLLNKITIDDGRHFLNTEDKYDLIIIDTAISYLTYHLATQEFFEEAHQHLTNNGALLVLVHTSLEGADKEPGINVFKTLKTVFADVLPFHQKINARNDGLFAIPFLAAKEKLAEDEIITNIDKLLIKNIQEEKKDIISFNFQLKEQLENNPYQKISTDHNPEIEKISLKIIDKTRRRILQGNVEVFLP